MKKTYHIEVELDPELAPHRAGCAEDATGKIIVRVGSALKHGVITAAPADMADVLAHEFGHVIARIVGHPAQKNDPRTAPFGFYMPPDEAARNMLEHEKVAWDYARKMRPELDQANIDFYLSSYTNNEIAEAVQAASRRWENEHRKAA